MSATEMLEQEKKKFAELELRFREIQESKEKLEKEKNDLNTEKEKLEKEKNDLNTEKEKLEKEKSDLNTENEKLREQNNWLTEHNRCLMQELYGQKSEKSKVVQPEKDDPQMRLFNEAEVNQSISEQKDEEEIVVKGFSRRKKRTREEIYAGIPEKEITIPCESTTCEICGAETVVIGKEKVRDLLYYIPAQIYMLHIFIEVRKCPKCGQDESQDANSETSTNSVLYKAKAPEPVLPKSLCSAELLSHVIHEKYVMGTPLDRLSRKFKEMKCPISVQTLSNWVVEAAERYFKPIYERLHETALKEKLLHADETTLQVLDEENRNAKTVSRMWVFCTGKYVGKQIKLYAYRQTRKRENAAEFLKGFSGWLVTDGFSGYNDLPGITRCGCWAHLRRKFKEALPDDPEIKKSSMAMIGFNFCNKLYALEREYEESHLTLEQIREARKTRSAKIVQEFFEWAANLNISGKSKLSEAITYTLNQKDALARFLDDPTIPIDNNAAERTVKPFVIGRKNWLFSKTPRGADASAMIYSVLNTALENGLNTQEYMLKLFKEKTDVLPF